MKWVGRRNVYVSSVLPKTNCRISALTSIGKARRDVLDMLSWVECLKCVKDNEQDESSKLSEEDFLGHFHGAGRMLERNSMRAKLCGGSNRSILFGL